MTKQEIEQEVSRIICAQFGVESVKLTTTFNDLGFDSLDAIELVMEFEDEFEISIADQDAEKMGRGQDVVDFLCTVKQVAA